METGKRILEIECCRDCTYHNHDDGFEANKWGKRWCEKVDAKIVGNVYSGFPEMCPLPKSLD